jgi:hypothetical protein
MVEILAWAEIWGDRRGIKSLEDGMCQICAGKQGRIGKDIFQNSLVLFIQGMSPGILHILNKGIYSGAGDPLKVISYAHIKFKGPMKPQNLAEKMKEEPGFKILVKGLIQGEFGGPFNIITFTSSVDAGFFKVQPVQNLNGFQLEKTGAGQITAQDILGQLGVWSRRRTKGKGRVVPGHPAK